MRCGEREELGRRKRVRKMDKGRKKDKKKRINERIGSEKSAGLALIEKTLTLLPVPSFVLPLFLRHSPSPSRFLVVSLRGLRFISLEICEV